MRNYDAAEWQSSPKSCTIPLTTRDTIELDVVSPGVITIYAISSFSGEHTPIKCGAHHVHIKTKFEGFEALEIQSTKELGYRYLGRAGQIGEPMDDRTPPPPKEPTNILQQMRGIIKQELASNRENFLTNDTPFEGYEVEEENEDFEEEALEKVLTKANAKKQAPPPVDPTPAADTTSLPQETPSNAE